MILNYNVTEDALWVMTFAEMAAARDGRDAATPLDVLLGLMVVSDPVFDDNVPCLGGQLLRAACTSPDDLPTLGDLGWRQFPEEPSFGGKMTPGVTELFESACLLASDFALPFVGSEHILVSLLAGSFGSDTDAWLEDAGLTEAGVLKHWIAFLLRA